MEKKNTGFIIVIGFLSLLVLGCGSYLVYDKFIAKDGAKEEDKTNQAEKSAYEKFVDTAKSSRIESTLYDNGDIKVKMTSIGEIVLDATFANAENVSNVIKSFKVSRGDDMCEGNTYFVFIKEDGTIAALSLDSLVCGNIVKLKNTFGGLTNIVEVYAEEVIPASDLEPAINEIYAKDIDGKVTSISSFLFNEE